VLPAENILFDQMHELLDVLLTEFKYQGSTAEIDAEKTFIT
jgi:hypothetical protein